MWDHNAEWCGGVRMLDPIYNLEQKQRIFGLVILQLKVIRKIARIPSQGIGLLLHFNVGATRVLLDIVFTQTFDGEVNAVENMTRSKVGKTK